MSAEGDRLQVLGALRDRISEALAEDQVDQRKVLRLSAYILNLLATREEAVDFADQLAEAPGFELLEAVARRMAREELAPAGGRESARLEMSMG